MRKSRLSSCSMLLVEISTYNISLEVCFCLCKFDKDLINVLVCTLFVIRWSVIARHLPKRTDNEVKNYWNTHLKKRLIDDGIDPVTHKPLASSNPSPAEPKKFDSQEESNPDEHSSTTPVSLPLSSSFNSTKPEISSDETLIESDFFSCKKRFERSSSTSRLLNKVAARGASIGKILSTSIEGTLRSPTPSSCLPNSFPQSSEPMIDNKEDLGTRIDLSIQDYDFPQFLEQFINDDNEAENIGGPTKISLCQMSHQHSLMKTV